MKAHPSIHRSLATSATILSSAATGQRLHRGVTTNTNHLSRRSFIKGAAVLGAPLIIPASAIGRGNRPSPSNRITLGCIGMGGMGSSLLREFLPLKDSQVVAVSTWILSGD
jgi:hypothetical protein